MTSHPKCLWEILVPAHDNEGNEFSVAKHQSWDKWVWNKTGGITIMKSAKGKWVNIEKGKIFHDTMIPVRILCSTSEINSIARHTANFYQQEAVMFYEISDKAFIIDKNGVPL